MRCLKEMAARRKSSGAARRIWTACAVPLRIVESTAGVVDFARNPRARNSGESHYRYAPLVDSLVLIACLTLTAASANGAGDLAQTYATRIQPLLVRSCGDCHGKEPKDNDLDLTSFESAQAILAKPSLFLHLMDWGGLELDQFGDSNERLTGIC